MLVWVEKVHNNKGSSVSTNFFCLNLCIRQKLQILGGCIYTSKVFNTIVIYIIIGFICDLHILLKEIYQFLNLTWNWHAIVLNNMLILDPIYSTMKFVFSTETSDHKLSFEKVTYLSYDCGP
jgi:uncharacterized membrane protein